MPFKSLLQPFKVKYKHLYKDSMKQNASDMFYTHTHEKKKELKYTKKK